MGGYVSIDSVIEMLRNDNIMTLLSVMTPDERADAFMKSIKKDYGVIPYQCYEDQIGRHK